jgi:hypothetical protein
VLYLLERGFCSESKERERRGAAKRKQSPARLHVRKSHNYSSLEGDTSHYGILDSVISPFISIFSSDSRVHWSKAFFSRHIHKSPYIFSVVTKLKTMLLTMFQGLCEVVSLDKHEP